MTKLISYLSRKVCYVIIFYLKRTSSDRAVAAQKIIVYPAFKDSKTSYDILNRIAWALGKSRATVSFLGVKPVPFVNSQENFVHQVQNLQHIDTADLRDFDLILIHSWKSFFFPSIWFKWEKTRLIDPVFFSSTESDQLRKLSFEILADSEKQRIFDESSSIFSMFLKRVGNKTRSICFTTGPSFDQYGAFRYSSTDLKIVCNSAVKNTDFLSVIGGPDIIVFADPVFHFSPSTYAHLFRDYVLNCTRLYPEAILIIPESSVPILLGWYPELSGKVLGIRTQREFHFPTANSFSVRSSDNVLTFLMLPLASALTKEVAVIGADGRNPDEKYFWQHSKTAQMHSHMDSAFQVHPSFFRDRNYASYYDQHCDFLEQLLKFGESKGITYYSLTPSYIPSFKSRSKK